MTKNQYYRLARSYDTRILWSFLVHPMPGMLPIHARIIRVVLRHRGALSD